MARYILFRNVDEKIAEKYTICREKFVFSSNLTEEGIREILYRFKSVKISIQLALFYYRIKLKKEVKNE